MCCHIKCLYLSFSVQGSLVEGGKGPPALDDVMLSCAEEDLPITALLNVSRSCLHWRFSASHSEVRSTVTDMAYSALPQ